jgi:L-lactate dehydrogenase complex protein LldF
VKATSHAFKQNAHDAMGDATLQRALQNIRPGFQAKRAAAIAKVPEWELLRDQGKAIKDHVLAHLDHYLERFAAKVEERGGQVHWARTAGEANEAILEICRSVGAKTVTKGKSMVAEETGLNDFLEANGIQPIETDLGEYIIQLRHETPSHIVAPAIHLTQGQVEETFRANHTHLAADRPLGDPQQLLGEARAELRQKYLAADVGITGANLLIAETGSTVIVTNEGNGDLTQCLPRVHIVLASLEKIVPTLEDAASILRLLPRSATGQDYTSYITYSTGPKRPGDLDGPDQFHVVLLDNGRTSMLGSEFQEMLRCIRCAACINHCPVYQVVGGHAYGWVYPGPMGAVLTPKLIGVEEAGDLPNASTFCGRCEQVCPMKIPLPKMMRHWREREFERHLSPTPMRYGLRVWGWLARHPGLYRVAIGLAAGALGRLGRASGRFRSLPLASGWTSVRDLPAPQGKSFHAMYRAKATR